MAYQTFRCTRCGGDHTLSKCPWPGSALITGEKAREVARIALALIAVAFFLGVCGQMDLVDAQLLAR